MTASSIKISTKDPRFRRQIKQELLAVNARRMLVFCAVFVVYHVFVYVFNANADATAFLHNTTIVFFGEGAVTQLSIAALVLGVLCGIFCALSAFGLIRSPNTQNIIQNATLIALSCIQLVFCVVELNTSILVHYLLVYLLMLGTIPLMSHLRSVIFIVGFALLCWFSYFFLPLILSPENAEFLTSLMASNVGPYSPLSGMGPMALTFEAVPRGTTLLVPAVIVISLIASWLSYRLFEKQVQIQLAAEQREGEIEQIIEERTAAYKEEARVAGVSNQLKTRFLTRVSHEMRSSLTTIMGMTFLARETDDATSRQENLDAVLLASQKLKGVVDNIIDNSELDNDAVLEDIDQDLTMLNAETNGHQEQDERVETPDLTGHTLLIVEDLETNRLVLREFLRHTNATIEEAENGRIAVQKFADSPENYYSFIFMDLLMPEMNGHDATRAIRKMERSDALSVPIVAVSANAFKEDIETSLAAGMDAHLAKPIEQSTIFRVLIERLT